MLKSDGNGNWILKKWAGMVLILITILSCGYSFAITFEIKPLKKKVDIIEPKVEANKLSCTEIAIHFSYIQDELKELNRKIDGMQTAKNKGN